MQFFKVTYLICCIVTIVAFASCVEPFDAQTEVFEDALVIEASLTNETKRHQVILSRAVRFEDSINAPERSAQVRIVDEMQNVYEFEETEAGIYSSIQEFAAKKSIDYTLTVQTNDGTNYSSEPASFESESQLENVYANRGLNDNNEDGVFIYADSFDSSGKSQYYRYEYEETYEIVAPFWRPVDFVLTNYQPCNPDSSSLSIIYDLNIEERKEEEQVCYKTLKSSEISQTSSVDFSDSRIERFPIRFISSTDFILTHRYSILVKQFVQSADAFSYYQSLNNFSSSKNVFSEIQPGFLKGNISVKNNANKKVLGYFEVASVTKNRIFFGFRDFYPDAPLPLFIKKCTIFSAPLEHISFCYSGPPLPISCPESLIEQMARNSITYYDGADETDLACQGPYLVVERACGDCTALGSNVVPDFWVE